MHTDVPPTPSDNIDTRVTGQQILLPLKLEIKNDIPSPVHKKYFITLPPGGVTRSQTLREVRIYFTTKKVDASF
jgi:hypothetical protein